MATNKIIYGNQTLIDLTSDTADVSDVVQGKTFHSADGTQKTGTKVDVTPISIEPSLSAPAMTANSIYKPSADGYAIDDYTNVNPSDDDSGTYFASGFNKMSSSGWAYKNKPSGGQMTETVLWTNSNPSAATGFAAQAAALSDDINNYEWIAVEYARQYNALTEKNKVYWKVSDFKTFITTANRKCGGLTLVNNIRTFYYDNDTQAHFGANLASGTATNTLNIPLYIYGCKIN